MQCLVKIIAILIITFPPVCLSAQTNAPSAIGTIIRDNTRTTLPQQQNKLDFLNKNTPPVAPDVKNQVLIEIKAIEIIGATLVDTEILHALIKPYSSGKQSLVTLNQAAKIISDYYHNAGYFLAYAVVPPQKVTNGIVSIQVIESYFGNITLTNHSRVDDLVLNKYLFNLKQNKIVNKYNLDRSLLLIGDMAGIAKMQAQIAPGKSVGLADLNIGVQATPPVNGSVSFDNGGSLYSGKYELTTSLQANSLLGRGETIGVSLVATNQDLLAGSFQLALPILADGLVMKFGADYAKFKLGDRFKDLGIEGNSNDIKFGMQYPFIRTAEFSLYGLADIVTRNEHDEIKVASEVTDKTDVLASLGLSAYGQDHLGQGGLNNAHFHLYKGKLNIKSPLALADDQATYRTNGDYSKLTVSLERIQLLDKTPA